MLQGTLDDFRLPEVLTLLASTGKSGALTVVGDECEGRVDLRDGSVCFAAADVRRAAFGSRLVAAGVLTPERLAALTDPSGVDLGRLLVEAARLADGRLEDLVHAEITDAVCDVLRQRRGTFAFAAGQPVDLGVTVEVHALLAEAERREAAWPSIARHIPSVHVVPALVPNPPAGVVTLDPGQWRLVALADERRTVADIAVLAGWSEFATSQVLAGLAEAGLVEASAQGERTRLGDLVTTSALVGGALEPAREAPSPASTRGAAREPAPTPAQLAAAARARATAAARPARVESLAPAAHAQAASTTTRPSLPQATPRSGVASEASRAALARELAALGTGDTTGQVGAPRPPAAPADRDAARGRRPRRLGVRG